MSELPAINLRYEGVNVFRAISPRDCDRHFVVGETAAWEPRPDRSDKSHAHYFAVINDAWASLPETMAGRFPSSEHMRKWALIKAGYCNTDAIVLESPMDAMAVAAYARRRDGYAVVSVVGNVVTTYTAQSQSKKAMGRKAFGESKQRVLDVLSELVGADVTASQRAA